MHAQNFFIDEQVAEVGFRVKLARRGRDARVNRAEIGFPFRVFDVDDAFGREKLAVPGVARRHHAVEHVDAERDAFEDVRGRTDPHQITRFVGGQNGGDEFGHRIHFFDGFADREAADGIAFAAKRGDGFGRNFPQFGESAALHNRKKSLRVAMHRLGRVEMLAASFEPAMGKLHRVFGVLEIAGIRGAFIEGHNDVCADNSLNINGFLRRKKMFGAVDMALESHAVLLYFSPMGERINLVAAAVGQNRAIPAVEFVQSACHLQHFEARSEV